MNFPHLLLSLGTLAVLATIIKAEEEERPKGLTINLIPENSTIAPGQPFTVGLHIKHEKGYHTYWKNPGVVGMATKIDWKLPEGFTASEIHWPYPELTKMASHPCHGYERDVTLLVTITPPQTITAKQVTLNASAAWMCCADSCHPGLKKFALTLAVAPQTTRDATAAKLILQAREEIPRTSKAWAVVVLTGPNEKSVRLKIAPPTGTSAESVYLFSCDGQISSDQKQTVTAQADGSWILTTQRNEFSGKNLTHLPSVLKVGQQHILIFPKYPK